MAHRALSWPKRLTLIALALFFCLAGVNHFTDPDFFVAIMPPYLPAHLELVYVSGVFEILGGLGLLLPALRKKAGIGLLALLVAVYPANIHMAMHPELFSAVDPGFLYLRLALQFVFGWLVWWAAVSDPCVPATSP